MDNLWLKVENIVAKGDSFWCLCSRRLLKTLWQKQKLLMMSNFFFCHNFFLTQFNNSTLVYERFSRFYQYVFKVVCCSFELLCGKGSLPLHSTVKFPSPHTSNLQQTILRLSSQWYRKSLKNENIYNQIELKTFWQKEKLLLQ